MVPIGQKFEFSDYEIDWIKKIIFFNFRVVIESGKEITFKETLQLPDEPILRSKHDLPFLKAILDSLHLVLGISYYKLYCPRKILIRNFSLSETQAKFWNTVYTKGLGEFFYKNKIDYRGLVNFPFETNKETVGQEGVTVEDNSLKKPAGRALVGIGGGKDSIVVAEMLKRGKTPFTAFILNPKKLQKDVVNKLAVSSLEVTRILDTELFNLVKAKRVFDGHIPISAVYAFMAFLIAALYDYDTLIFSNEKSANFGNVYYLGNEINHQWSKSEEFEDLFTSYVREFITPDIIFSSPLRSFSEFEIVRRFADLKQYHMIFSSCNRNFKLNQSTEKKWCGNCAKCAFVFLMLAAFINKDELLAIFGQNLLEKETLLPMYRRLLGIDPIKPFDCVGTPEEARTAFKLILKNKEYDTALIINILSVKLTSI